MAVLGVNHIAFRTADPAGLRQFYLELLDCEPLAGAHDVIRAGSVVLAFFPSQGGPAEDPDEIAFDVDATGFEQALARARVLGAVQRAGRPEPLAAPHDDRGVYWQED